MRTMSSVPLRASAAAAVIGILFNHAAHAQDAAELAKKLSNPIAALISVPLQLN